MGMTVMLHRFIALLMLVCLPLQVFASMGVVSCAERMPDCAGMQVAGTHCCDPANQSHAGAMNHDAASGDHAQHDTSPCAGANTCAPVMTMAALPSASAVTIIPTKEAWHRTEPPSYRSHIPDGLHRPPSLLA